MDHLPLQCLFSLAGFPRPRGDGPGLRDHVQDMPRVSPPTRGWTAGHPNSRLTPGGFPAHAGMDLGGTDDRCAGGWFPRPRGDGPAACQTLAGVDTVSPPTRGWTPPRRSRSRRCAGFPAHAGMDLEAGWMSNPQTGFPRPRGMDPPPTSVQDMAYGFPRPRGDGPAELHSSRRDREVSPPTRGWTAFTRFTVNSVRGFPAHAGMDLKLVMDDGTEVRFPRPRGDGPFAQEQTSYISGVSPPTRGWTRYVLPAVLDLVGFPAHAGMDPLTLGQPATAIRFPRPRGDGPGQRPRSGVRFVVSPPTRGWT